MFSKTATPKMIAKASPPDGYKSIVSNSPFGWHVGPFFEKEMPGNRVKRGFRVADDHLNAGGVCHGGMLMTFADILIASAVFKVAAPPFVTIKLSTNFVSSAKCGQWVEGEAEVVGLQDGFASVEAALRNESEAVATISAVFKALGARR
ncbi:PaaI family thioesterase [Kordiimonas sp. SCSIO 12610]|uniref:PaaI family thioesterase n=1 Tax=Kordiimonas sp. SCSIO 12610 TaxID=2829597 RepID=UPI00210943B8|nr:PaaI family thioesterase [Kordiimonas sp. SCSIO 12610]UTW56627.1 PaaI family thioesterase [Kordiimonas sp. SCSIO 12610]